MPADSDDRRPELPYWLAGQYQYVSPGKSVSGRDRHEDNAGPTGDTGISRYVEFTAEGGAYFRVYVDGVEYSKHTKQYKAQSVAAEQKTIYPDSEVWYEYPESRLVAKTNVIIFPTPLGTVTPTGNAGTAATGTFTVELGSNITLDSATATTFVNNISVITDLDHTEPVEAAPTATGAVGTITVDAQTDVAPTISSTPSPSFTDGIAATYDMTQHVSDDGLSTVVYTLTPNPGLPLSFNTSTGILSYNGDPGSTVTGVTLTATDAIDSATSDPFSIQIVADAADFATRASSVGGNLVLSTNFPTEAYKTAHQHKQIGQSGYDTLQYDSSTYRSGGGSLRFTATSNLQNDWRINMGETPGDTTGTPVGTDYQFGLKGLDRDLGDVCCIQFRIRFESALLNTEFTNLTGRGGWKISIFSKGDTDAAPSSSSGEGSSQLESIVLQNIECSGLPRMYHSGGTAYNITDYYDSGGEDWSDSEGRRHIGSNTYDTHLHNAVTTGNANPYLDRPLKTGMRDYTPNPSGFGESNPPYQMTYDTIPAEYLSSFPGSFFHPDEWMTIQMRITLGDLGSADSTSEGAGILTGWTNSKVELWMARDNQASVKLIEKDGLVIQRGDGAVLSRDGLSKLWLTKFHTDLSAAQSPEAYYWIDELIVSKSLIPDPATGVVPPGSGNTELDNVIADLSVGEFREWYGESGVSATSWPGGNSVFWATGPNSGGRDNDHVMVYANKGFYDPINKKIVVSLANYGSNIIIEYDTATNTWSRSAKTAIGFHSWDTRALDTTRGVLYCGSNTGTSWRSIDISTGADSAETAMNNLSGTAEGYMTEYWPEEDALVYISSNASSRRVFKSQPPGSAWVQVDTFSDPEPGYHCFACYSPVEGAIFNGGGNLTPTAFRKTTTLSSGGTSYPSNTGNPGVDSVRDHPLCGDNSLNGDPLIFSMNDQTVYRYTGSNWVSHATMPSNLLNTDHRTVAIPLRGYGKDVFMLMSNSGISSPTYCYLYRYS